MKIISHSKTFKKMKKSPFFSAYYGKNTTLKSKVLSHIDDFKRFQNYYNHFHGVEVDISYLLISSLVRVFYISEDQWLAGYVINDKCPMRYFEPFTDSTKRIIFRDAGINEDQSAEITCIWIDNKLTRSDTNARLFVYRSSIQDAAKTGKEYVIGGSIILTVWRTFQIVLPHTFYFGLVPFQDRLEMGKIVYNQAQDALDRFENYLISKFN
jgi:hypothetical protein